MTFEELIKGQTQIKFADAMGVSQQCVSKWKNKKSIPRIDTIQKLAEVLGVSVSEIMAYFYNKPQEIEI